MYIFNNFPKFDMYSFLPHKINGTPRDQTNQMSHLILKEFYDIIATFFNQRKI